MYKWEMFKGKISYEGEAQTLHAAIDSMIHYSYGRDIRDFYVNGHHMNEEFGLWISEDKVVHDDGSVFVPMNKWYNILRKPNFVQTSSGAAMEIL